MKLFNTLINERYLSHFRTFCKINNISSDIDLNKNPKIEFRYICFKLIPYVLRIPINYVTKKSDYEAVLIEFRKLHHLVFLIRNTILKLDDKWCHTIVIGKNNYKFIKKITNSIHKNIKIIQLNVDNLSREEYSLELMKKSFWERFEGKKIFIYQEDSILFRNIDDKFLEYDYIGAPWNNTYVGNGGFSIRSKDIMLKIIEEYTISTKNIKIIKHFFEKLIIEECNKKKYLEANKIKNYYEEMYIEDMHFTKMMRLYNIGTIAPFELANEFSVENIKHSNPCGGHQIWNGIKKWKNWMIGSLDL